MKNIICTFPLFKFGLCEPLGLGLGMANEASPHHTANQGSNFQWKGLLHLVPNCIRKTGTGLPPIERHLWLCYSDLQWFAVKKSSSCICDLDVTSCNQELSIIENDKYFIFRICAVAVPVDSLSKMAQEPDTFISHLGRPKKTYQLLRRILFFLLHIIFQRNPWHLWRGRPTVSSFLLGLELQLLLDMQFSRSLYLSPKSK